MDSLLFVRLCDMLIVNNDDNQHDGSSDEILANVNPNLLRVVVDEVVVVEETERGTVTIFRCRIATSHVMTLCGQPSLQIKLILVALVPRMFLGRFQDQLHIVREICQ